MPLLNYFVFMHSTVLPSNDTAQCPCPVSWHSLLSYQLANHASPSPHRPAGDLPLTPPTTPLTPPTTPLPPCPCNGLSLFTSVGENSNALTPFDIRVGVHTWDQSTNESLFYCCWYSLVLWLFDGMREGSLHFTKLLVSVVYITYCMYVCVYIRMCAAALLLRANREVVL